MTSSSKWSETISSESFRESGGVISTAASRLGMPRTTKKLGISRADL
jgi:hypothetical protein